MAPRVTITPPQYPECRELVGIKEAFPAPAKSLFTPPLKRRMMETRFARITIIYSRYINSMMTFCVNISSPFHGNSLSNSFLSLSLLSISRKVSSRSMYSPLVKLQLRAYKTPSPDPRTADRLATTVVRASIERLQKEGRSGGGVGGKYA